MKVICSVLIFFLLILTSAFSQVDIPFFDKMIGEWEGSYEVSGSKNTEKIHVEWILKHSFLEIDITGQEVDNPDLKYYQKYVFTLDNKDNLVGWGLSDNGYNDMITFKGKYDDKSISVDGTNPNYIWNVIYSFKDGKLKRKSEFKKKNSDKGSTVEVLYSKK